MTTEFDKEWALEQLAAAKVSIPVGNTVLKLLETWDKLPDLSTPEQATEALRLFTMLAQGTAVVDSTERWIPAHSGIMIKIGQTVRIAPDAFKGSAGKIHNGRKGRVVAKRSGDIIIDSTDGKNPKILSAHYPPNVVEILAD